MGWRGSYRQISISVYRFGRKFEPMLFTTATTSNSARRDWPFVSHWRILSWVGDGLRNASHKYTRSFGFAPPAPPTTPESIPAWVPDRSDCFSCFISVVQYVFFRRKTVHRAEPVLTEQFVGITDTVSNVNTHNPPETKQIKRLRRELAVGRMQLWAPTEARFLIHKIWSHSTPKSSRFYFTIEYKQAVNGWNKKFTGLMSPFKKINKISQRNRSKHQYDQN